MTVRCRKEGRDDLLGGMEYCYDPDDFNKRFYRRGFACGFKRLG